MENKGGGMMIRKISNNQTGSSIVSVMAAFLLLLIALAMVTTAMTVSLHIIRSADDVRKTTEDALAAYYTDGGEETDISAGDNLYFSPQEGDDNLGFYIPAKVKQFRYGTFELYTFE